MPNPSLIGEAPRIFLSYAHEDTEIAASLRSALTHEGAWVWTLEELNVSARTEAGVRAAIERSHLFLLLVTVASVASDWVQAELAHALELRDVGEATKIVPVVVGDARVPSVVDRFYSLEVQADDWTRVAQRLLEAGPHVGVIPEADFEEEVGDLLEELGVAWERQPVRGGVRPDFIVRSSDDRLAVIEAKARDRPSLFEVLVARTEAARLADAVGADSSFVVFRSLRERVEKVFDTTTLRAGLANWATDEAPSGRKQEAHSPDEGGGTVFVATPFSPEYSDVYWVAARGAAGALGLGCVRVDELDYTGDVTAKIKALISESVAVIADASEARPNVMYEAGFAHALDRPCVHICSTPLDELPFDIRNWNTMRYRKGETWKLTDELEKRLRGVLNP